MMPKVACILFALFFTLSSLVPAHAVVLDWQEVEGARIRLSFQMTPRKKYDGSSIGLIEVELDEGWKTYWKNPGSSGMPPQITINDEAWEIHFPTPSLIKDKVGDGWVFGYKSRVTFPFFFRRKQERGMNVKEISGTLHIGICKEICIPAQIDFHAPNAYVPDTITEGRFEAVYAALPQWAREQFSVISAQRADKHIILQLKVLRKEKIKQLFVDARDVELGLPELVAKTKNTQSYRVPILSGSLPEKARIDYVVRGSRGNARAYVILP